jgi:hypothetical protein
MSSYAFTGVAYGNGRFVAVGNAKSTLPDAGGGWLYTDSQTKNGITTWLRGVAYGLVSGNPLFVAVGESGTILTTEDGSTWTGRSAGIVTDLRGVAYGLVSGNPLFVAVGASGKILTSPDGKLWTPSSAGGAGIAELFRAVAYGNNTFVVARGNDSVFTSTDGGATWNSKSVGSNLTPWGIGFGDNTFVLVGSATTGPALSGIWTSPDGATWTKNTHVPPASQLNAVAFGANRFVAVGEVATILQSGEILSRVDRPAQPTLGGRLSDWVIALLRRIWPF